MWKRAVPALAGIFIPNLLGLLAVRGTAAFLTKEPNAALILISSEFIIIPMLMGFASAFCWRTLDAGVPAYLGGAALNTLVALGISYLAMSEGIICLLIVSPLIFTFVITGTLIGRHAFKPSNRLMLSLVPLLLGVLVVDARTPHYHAAVVTDTLLVHASPREVWPYVVQVPLVPPSRFWLFQLGMPRPVQTVARAAAVGSLRKCIFEGNLVVDEKIVTLDAEKALAFDIVGQPAHPEIMGHLSLTRGQIRLRDNGDGTTTLIGSTWYQLHVYPAWYYQLWSDQLCREVHRSVMEHIKGLAEKRHGAAA
jgi:hypothetical protein